MQVGNVGRARYTAFADQGNSLRYLCRDIGGCLRRCFKGPQIAVVYSDQLSCSQPKNRFQLFPIMDLNQAIQANRAGDVYKLRDPLRLQYARY